MRRVRLWWRQRFPKIVGGDPWHPQYGEETYRRLDEAARKRRTTPVPDLRLGAPGVDHWEKCALCGNVHDPSADCPVRPAQSDGSIAVENPTDDGGLEEHGRR